MTNRRRTSAGLAAALVAAWAAAGLAAQGRGGGTQIPPTAGQRPTATEERPAVLAAGPGIIIGRVVEAGTTTGVPGATVLLGGPTLFGAVGAVFDDGTPSGPRQALTDNQGQFLFRGLPVGAYSMSATAVGYIRSQYGDTRIIQVRRSLDLNRTVDITDSGHLVNGTIQMWKTAGIGGRVVDEHGEPMVGVPVSLITRMVDWGGPVMQTVGEVLTDDRGVYHGDVTPGDYIVGVLTSTITIPVTEVQRFTEAQSQGREALSAFSSEVAANGGIMPRGYGSRIGGFMVSQFGNQNAPVVPPTGDSGLWYASAYHPSSPTTMSATVVSVRSGEEKPGIDIVMRPVPGRVVSGRIVGLAGPATGLAVLLVVPDSAVQRTSPAALIDTPRGVANGNGEFALLGVPPGTYTAIVVKPPSSPADTSVYWASLPVAIGDTDITGLELRLESGARVSGRIETDSATSASPTPDQLKAMLITARAVPGTPGAMVFVRPINPERPDPETFATTEYIPGRYMLEAQRLPPGWILKSATSKGQNLVDRAFELPASGLSDVVVTITNRISTLTGIARGGDGAPAPSATVAVFPADRALWRIPGMASRRVRTAAPGADGRYAFSGLPEGDYLVVAVDWPTADFSDGTVLSALSASASRVTIGDGTTHTQDLRVAVRR